MATLSQAIAPKVSLALVSDGGRLAKSRALWRHSTRPAPKSRVFAGIKSHSPAIDFTDPDWKSKFQSDFERRFNIPHITDVFEDAASIPSTFCLKMRTPITEDFVGGYPSDEEWHGYINNNDRVLLKVN